MKYFVAYYWLNKKTEQEGWGNTVLSVSARIKSWEDVTILKEGIIKNNLSFKGVNTPEVIIINFIKL
jgi:hypothetical protein